MRKKLAIAMVIANSLVVVLFALYSGAVSVAGNAAMLVCLAVLATDLLYAVFAKNVVGFWVIPAEAGLFLLSYFARQNASVTLENVRSVSWLNAAALFAMPLLATAFLVLDLTGVGRGEIKLPFIARLLKQVLSPVLLVGLFAFALLGYDHVYNYGNSYHEYTTTRADFLFIAMIFAISCIFLREFIKNRQGEWRDYLRQGVSVLVIFALLSGFGTLCYARGYFSLKTDVTGAEAEYQAVFGESSKAYGSDARAVPLSLPNLLFGICHEGDYEVIRDVPYRTIGEGEFAGLHLAYDAFLPTAPDAHRSAVIMLHGSGGDKTEGNKMHLNKYLASKGYAVYDLQVGDFNEKNTGYPEDAQRDWDLMLASIDAFFAYAARQESENANFDSTFLIGSSMGGFLATDYMYNYEHNYQDNGVDIRGIVPLYGVVSDAEIDKNSVPVLIYIGDHDGTVSVWDAYELREKYREAANNNAILLNVSYAGHGCDSHFSSRGAQLELYYLERFLGKLR